MSGVCVHSDSRFESIVIESISKKIGLIDLTATCWSLYANSDYLYALCWHHYAFYFVKIQPQPPFDGLRQLSRAHVVSIDTVTGRKGKRSRGWEGTIPHLAPLEKVVSTSLNLLSRSKDGKMVTDKGNPKLTGRGGSHIVLDIGVTSCSICHSQ